MSKMQDSLPTLLSYATLSLISDGEFHEVIITFHDRQFAEAALDRLEEQAEGGFQSPAPMAAPYDFDMRSLG